MLLRRKKQIQATAGLPSIPKSWSELSWQQLCLCWQVKMRYGGNADVARVAALFALLGLSTCRSTSAHPRTGEARYCLRDANGYLWTVTPREAAHQAMQALSWFDYPYGDPGEPEQKDKDGNILKERREPVRGYVSPMRDAMFLPIEKLKEKRGMLKFLSKHFALPQLACNNITWQQYRTLQTVVPQLFADGITDEQALELQAQFLAHILTPRTVALLDTAGGSIRIRPHYEYRYNAEQAEGTAEFWKRKLFMENRKANADGVSTLFHVCFQVYQTALSYYSLAYPLLFTNSGKSDPLRDALTGEVGTINTIMKYAGYAEQQQVYDSNLPFVLDILNTMTKEAREIEKMNAKIKKK